MYNVKIIKCYIKFPKFSESDLYERAKVEHRKANHPSTANNHDGASKEGGN